MFTPFNVFALVVVFLLWWIGTNVHAIAKRGEPARDPEDRPLTWREHWIISSRPDHAEFSSTCQSKSRRASPAQSYSMPQSLYKSRGIVGLNCDAFQRKTGLV